MEIQAVILAGGRGSRMGLLTQELPKPMLPIQNKPVLEYQIENLKKNGITKILLVIGHLGNKIQEYFGDGSGFGVEISYFEEKSPLGTAGAFYYLREQLPELFLIVYGDLIFDLNLSGFIQFHKSKHARCTLMVHPNDHPQDSDLIVINEDCLVQKILRKNLKREAYYSNCVNAGMILLDKKLLLLLQSNLHQDLENDLIEPALRQGCVYAYKTPEYLRDMGTPDRYALVQEHVLNGIPQKKNLETQQRAIFFDREIVDQLSMPDFIAALEFVNRSEYLAILISSQSEKKNLFSSKEKMQNAYQQLEMDLGSNYVYLDDLFYCSHYLLPHAVDHSDALCNCWEPQTGLIANAIAKYNIDLSASYLISNGDRHSKMERITGFTTQHLSGFFEGEEDLGLHTKNLVEAVKLIVNEEALWLC